MNVLIGTRQLRGGEELRCELSEYRGRTYFSARKWYRDKEAGELKPGKGLTVPADLVPQLRAWLERAEAEALGRGLLDEESFESAGLPLPEAQT